jgi:hypothetical protein
MVKNFITGGVLMCIGAYLAYAGQESHSVIVSISSWVVSGVAGACLYEAWREL